MKTPHKGLMIVRPPGSTVPIPVNPETDISTLAHSITDMVAREDYQGDDPRYHGKSYLEATIRSLANDATVDPDARTEFLDRTMGKPKQRIDTTSITVDLTGYLQHLKDKEDNGEVVDGQLVINDTDETEEGADLLC